MDQTSTLTIPPLAQHTHTIIFLHGQGDTAHNFAHSLQFSKTTTKLTLQQALPSFRWVFPQARLRRCASNHIMPELPRWFDIWNTNDFSDHEDLQAPGLRESVLHLHQLLMQEATALNGHWDRIVLAGISQGAATAVHTLLNLNLDAVSVNGERRLAAFMGFCCRMPFPGRTLRETRAVLGLEVVPDGDEVLRNTPVLLEHSTDDPVVAVRLGRELTDTLRQFGVEVVRKEYVDGGHWFHSPKGMDDAVEFLNVYAVMPMVEENARVKREAVRAGAMDLD